MTTERLSFHIDRQSGSGYSESLARLIKGRMQFQGEQAETATNAWEFGDSFGAYTASTMALTFPIMPYLDLPRDMIEATLESIAPGARERATTANGEKVSMLTDRIAALFKKPEDERTESDQNALSACQAAAIGLRYEGVESNLFTEAFYLPADVSERVRQVQEESKAVCGTNYYDWLLKADQAVDRGDLRNASILRMEAAEQAGEIPHLQADILLRSTENATRALSNLNPEDHDVDLAEAMILTSLRFQELDRLAGRITHEYFDGSANLAVIRTAVEYMIAAGYPPVVSGPMGESSTHVDYLVKVVAVAMKGFSVSRRFSRDRRFFKDVVSRGGETLANRRILNSGSALITDCDPFKKDPIS